MSEVGRYLITQVCVLCLLTIRNSLSDKITVANATCSMSVQLNEKTPKTITWDGRPLLRHCRFRFNVPNEHDYTFIINVRLYQVEDCSFQLLYFNGITTAPQKNYSCYRIPDRHIISDEKHIYIQFETHGKSTSLVKLEVSAEKHGSFSSGWSVLFFVVMLIAIFIFYMHKKGKNICEEICKCLKCCGQCVRGTAEACCDEIREQVSNCPDCNFIRTSDPGNATVTEQPRSQEPQANDSESQLSRRTSLADISLSGITPENPTTYPTTENISPYDPPPYELPPPSYEDVVKDVPPPSYSEHIT